MGRRVSAEYVRQVLHGKCTTDDIERFVLFYWGDESSVALLVLIRMWAVSFLTAVRPDESEVRDG